MDAPKVVSHEEWVEARKAFLEQEKEFTRQRDALSKARRALPWEKVEKRYVFEGPEGKVTLSDLFEGRSQLIVYHFMFGPDWEEGCKACSYLADHFERAVVHLNQRDVSLAAVSRAPYPALEAFRRRLGWTFTWVSSLESTFNQDFNVSFTQEEIDQQKAHYNYRTRAFPMTEAPGASVFAKNEAGEIFHTYSVYERGLDMFLTTYHYLDIVPKGRDEDGLSFSMEWLRLRDSYES